MKTMAILNVCVAAYDYTAQDEDELTVAENDVLYVFDNSDSDWWKVSRSLEGTEVGLLPSNYLEPVIDAINSIDGPNKAHAGCLRL